MLLSELEKNKLNKEEAKAALIKLLQAAHAGEKAAANAYYGHACSRLFISKIEKVEILEIYRDELHHRTRLFEMLTELGARPQPLREIGMFLVGFVIGFLCLFGGWFIPMYGAGKLESENVEEYEVATRLAKLSDCDHFIEELLVFAEIEWDHEAYFREKAETHWLAKYFPFWNRLNSRERIREDFSKF